MPHKTHFFLQKQIRREVKELFISVWMQNFAVQLLTLFIPIYFWQLGYGIAEIAAFFFVVYFAYFFLIPLGARLAITVGYEHAISISMPVNVLFYLSLLLIPSYSWIFYLTAVLFALAKALYWPAYHADFARFGKDGQRGRELSIFLVIGQITIFAAPLIAGTILEGLSFGWLFSIGSVLLLLSIIPLLSTKEKKYPQKVRYSDYYKEYFSKRQRRRFWTYLGLGEELVAMTVWPVLIFTIVGDFLVFGGILTAAMLVSAVILLFTGKLTDRIDKVKLMNITTLVYFASWFPKLFIATPLHAFFTDSFGQFSKTANMIPFTAIAYEEAMSEYKGRVIMGAVLFEMGYIVGKIFTAAILLALALMTDNLSVLMLVGAAMTLCYLLIKRNSIR